MKTKPLTHATYAVGYLTYADDRAEIHWARLPNGTLRVCHTGRQRINDFGVKGQWADADALPEQAEYIGFYDPDLTH